MKKENVAIENPNWVCFNCLKDFAHEKPEDINVFIIHEMGYGSQFDGFSTKINLCKDCIKKTNKNWWEFEVIEVEDYGGHYKYEDEIFEYTRTLPLAGQELFYSRFASGWNSTYMSGQDWIDYELGILPHEKCKQYGYYSPQEEKAYQERFPICKHVKLKIYNDGSKGCSCFNGAFGNVDGSAKGHQTQHKCYECVNFELREGEIMTIDLKEEEKKRIKAQIEMLKSRLKGLEK